MGVEVSPKASSLKRHIHTNRHVSRKKQRLKEIEHQQSITRSISSYDNEVHPQGKTLPEKERAFWIEVVETFLKAGVPLSKTSKFRSLLEKYATRLADRIVLAHLILLILTGKGEGRAEVGDWWHRRVSHV